MINHKSLLLSLFCLKNEVLMRFIISYLSMKRSFVTNLRIAVVKDSYTLKGWSGNPALKFFHKKK